VGLAFGGGVGNQGIIVELLGLPEHGARDIDRIVKGKLVDDVDRGIVETSRFESCARAATSISSANRPMTSPKVHISSSL
jgi:hypothetical protein